RSDRRSRDASAEASGPDGLHSGLAGRAYRGIPGAPCQRAGCRRTSHFCGPGVARRGLSAKDAKMRIATQAHAGSVVRGDAGEDASPAPSLRRIAGASILTVALGFGGLGLWAALTPLDSAVPAPGVFVTAGKRKTV